MFPRGNAPTTLWFSLPPAFCVRGLGLVLVLVERALVAGEVWLVVLVVLLDISKVGGGAQSRARDVCEVRIRLRIWTERISHAEALVSMTEAVVNSSSLLVRCVFVGDSSIFVTNITLFDSRHYCGCISFTGRRKCTLRPCVLQRAPSCLSPRLPAVFYCLQEEAKAANCGAIAHD